MFNISGCDKSEILKTSIVIPHYGDRAHDLLKPCLDSIIKYTNLEDCEVIIVANGCTKSAYDVVMDRFPDGLIWYDEAIGYAKACNRGIEIAMGEYIVLLNNDTEILPSPKNLWIDLLLRAFWDSKCAVSGPMMAWCPYAEHHFLIGFCTMFRKEALDQIGLYDETFEAYGEDCDICIRAKQNGWRIKQVPEDSIQRLPGQPSVGTGNFPIWHKGNESYRNWPGGEQLLAKNRKILHDRYATGIQKAYETDGFISPSELRWLAERARISHTVIELGSWHGRSARAIADNLPEGGRLYCLDTWAGSKVEQDTNHASAREKDGDAAFLEFCQNLWDHIESGRVVPLRMHGCHAASLLREKGVTADLIFLDGGHAKGETLTDISLFSPLLKKGGVMAGHDYRSGLWPDVTEEVLSVFGQYIGNPENTTIWYTDTGASVQVVAEEIRQPEAPKIYDCFIFNNENEILEKRLAQLDPVVDRFVIVEALKTHSGKPKLLSFALEKESVFKYAHKITYIVVDDLPEVEGTVTDKSWARERHQRDAIMRGLTECKDNDIIIISDVDEIPSVEAIKYFDGTNKIMSFDMDLFYYNHETKAEETWREAKILTYGLLKRNSPCWARYQKADHIEGGGEHLSYFGGVQAVQRKLENTAHREYDTDYYKDPERIRKAIEEKRDLFDRDYVKFQ